MVEEKYVGNGKVYLIAGGQRIYTDIAARFVRSERPVQEIIESPYNPKIVRNILESGHGAALEFDYFLFGVEGYSRVCEVQLVRKRMASYLIKSGRQELHGKRAFSIVAPKHILDATARVQIPVADSDVKWKEVYLDGHGICSIIDQWYEQNLEKGDYKEEDLRYLKPQATEFKAIIGMNIHALRDWLMIRECFDDRTEVLTTDGWKFFKDLTGNELFYSMDPETRIVEYVKAKELIVRDYKGKMISVKGRRLDLCTTPNHRNLVSVYPGKEKTREYATIFARCDRIENLEFIQASQMNNYTAVRMTRTCNSVKPTDPRLWITLPEVDNTRYSRGKLFKEITIPTVQLMKLLGLYISDGSLQHKISKKDGEPVDKSICIAKGDYRTCFRYAAMVSNWLNYDVPIYKMGENAFAIRIQSPQLYNFFQPFGTSASMKHIEPWVFGLPSFILRGLLIGFIDGDCGLQSDGHGSFSTVSKQLADDFQRLLLHCGLSGSIRVEDNSHPSTVINKNGEKQIIRGKYPIYLVSFTLRKVNSEPVKVSSTNTNISETEYDGKVYCVDLEKHHTLYVRRNGFPVWSGNCTNAQAEIRDLATKMHKCVLAVAPDLMEGAGPSCKVLGYCPEGRLQNERCKGKIPTKEEALAIIKEHYYKK